jgi:tripartite-type tricarboxylate transporter receptor subunit TctC
MKLPRRQFLHLAAGAAVLPAVSRTARADTYPTRPVRLIVGLAPGGASDVTARLMGQWLSERLGQQFIIENRPGAGGNIATETGPTPSPGRGLPSWARRCFQVPPPTSASLSPTIPKSRPRW